MHRLFVGVIEQFLSLPSRISQLSGLTAKSFEQLLLAVINLLKSNWMTGMEIRGSAYHHLILRW